MRNREAKNTSHLTLISVWNLEFGRLNEFILKVLCLGFELRLGGLEFRVWRFGFGFWGFGFRVQG